MRLLMLASAVVALQVGAAACSPNSQSVSADPATGNAAAAADTAGAHQMLTKDAAGVRLDSAGTKSPTGLGGTGSGNATATGATSPQGQ